MTPPAQKRLGASTKARASAGPSQRHAAPGRVTPRPSRASSTSGPRSRLGHERVAVVAGRAEGLLHGAGAHPADEVELRAGLVVGPRGARAAERLLSHDRPGGLVVDVEVAGAPSQ